MIQMDCQMPQKVSSIQSPPNGVFPHASKFELRVDIMHPIIRPEKTTMLTIATTFLIFSFLAMPKTWSKKLIQMANCMDVCSI